ncbi:MAG: HD domain-containing protein [Candidatus Promineifilaceae bacterium]
MAEQSLHLPAQVAWREAVQTAMREATEKEIVNRYGSLDVSFNYRWEHVTTVVTLAKKLALLTGADSEVVEAAAWLHDIRKESGHLHAIEGAEYAREFLKQTDFPPGKIEAVAHAIEVHMGLWLDEPLTNLEAMVLWDADKLAKIGLTAVFHWTGGSLAGHEIRDVRMLIDESRQIDWQEKTVASMHSEPAKRAARNRLAHYKWLWQALEEELNGDDLEA